MKRPGQQTRLLILAVYTAALFSASRFALGTWVPPTAEKGLWFYSGLAALLLGDLLVTPFYTEPANAVSYAVSGLVALLAVNIWSSQQRTGFDRFLWCAAMVYVASVILASLFSIALKDSKAGFLKKISHSLFLFSTSIGSPKLVFSAVFFFALVTFHRDSPREYVTISLTWFVLIGLQPLENLTHLLTRLRDVWGASPDAQSLGDLVAHQSPGLVLIRQHEEDEISFGVSLLVRAEDGKPGLAIALDYQGYSEGRWLRALHLQTSATTKNQLSSLSILKNLSYGAAIRPELKSLGIPEPVDDVWSRRDRLIGLVAEDTDVAQLRIEIVRTDRDIEEGRLVEVRIGSKPVLFQIINGLTKEEIIQQKNTRGYVRAVAKKIGAWNDGLKRFELVTWVPSPNAPAFLVTPVLPTADKEAVGYFPGTSYPITLDINMLVTHNAAILGILGVGKSFLALELVERMIRAGIKVICLDLTNQYANELVPFYRADIEQPIIGELQQIGPTGRTNFQQNVEEGGSIRDFTEKLGEILKNFMDPTNNERPLIIFNPSQFEVWRQEKPLYAGRAPMATLTPAEITRLIAEVALNVLQEQGMTETAKCCLVFEEAHSLIPEWSAVASEGDKTATNGTAKAILQGRKFGLGCLIITQRTANVTKSILNQCNTVFALRVFDATGMEFLKNYIGEDYAGALATLEDRHAVIFGRGSSCRNPVLVRLNERPEFLRLFREVGTETGCLEDLL